MSRDRERFPRPTQGPVTISASLLAADPSALGAEVARAQSAGVDRFHVDVMDGRYVTNLALAPWHVAALRRYSSLPFDLHLEVQCPDTILSAIPSVGVATVMVHLDTLDDPLSTFRRIRSAGMAVGLALNPTQELAGAHPWLPQVAVLVIMAVAPGFAGQSLDPGVFAKLAAARRLRDRSSLPFEIAVDGGVTSANAAALAAAGADQLITGTALFTAGDMVKMVQALKGIGRPPLPEHAVEE